jgi:hypothetical protein
MTEHESRVLREMDRTIKGYAISEHERLAKVYRVNPILQSAALQSMLYDAAQYRVSQRLARMKQRTVE